MNMLLPDSFKMIDEIGRTVAEVVWEGDDDQKSKYLYLYQPSEWPKVNYELAKCIHGHKCYYCGKKLLPNEITIDHVIPQVYGGPTLTNNLVPSCQACNSVKSSYTVEEFMYIRSLKTKKEKKAYERSLKEIEEDRYYGNVVLIPDEWISKRPFRELTLRFYIDEPLGARYKRMKWFMSKFKRYKDYVITSCDGYVVDGFVIIFWAKMNNRADYKQINVDNLRVIV